MKIYNCGNLVVNTYVMKLQGKTIVVDTGYQTHFRTFQKKFEKIYGTLSSIDYLFLTHAHDDHAGFLNEVLDHSNAKVIVHPRAVEQLYKGQNLFDGGCSNKRALLFCQLMKLLGHGEHRFPPFKQKHHNRLIILDESNRRELEEQLNVKIVDTPGHTTCSISLFTEEGVFAGDACMNGFPGHQNITIWIGCKESYLNSWKKIIELSPKRIYPSHGAPFDVSLLKKNCSQIAKRKLSPLS